MYGVYLSIMLAEVTSYIEKTHQENISVNTRWREVKKHTEFTFKLPALRIFENEHHLIRHLMSEWHPIVLAYENDAYTLEEGNVAIKQLRKKIIDFLDPLKNHN